MLLKSVAFDLDGTLVRQEIDFEALRSELGAGPGCDIIGFIAGLPEADRSAASRILERHEAEAAAKARFNRGAAQALEFLASRGLKTGIVTRNSRASVEAVCASLNFRVDVAVTRTDAEPKPHPGPVLAAARALAVEPREMAMVGDFAFDMESALAAGAGAVFLTNGEKPRARTRAHFSIESLDELPPVIERLLAGEPAPAEPSWVLFEPARKAEGQGQRTR